MNVDIRGMRESTTGDALLALKNRANRSLQVIAKAAGYAGKSSIQQFFSSEYSRALDTEVAAKLADALEGLGDPPIQRNEILTLTGVSEAQAVVRFEGASDSRMQQSLPIYGTGLGAERVVDDFAIEQTYLNSGETIGYVKRPSILDGRADAYGIYVQGSSMYPAHRDGSLVLVETKRPPKIGDDVVIYLRANGEEDADDSYGRARCVLVKRLVRRSASYIELEQFEPAMIFRIDAKDVSVIHRIMTLDDLLL